MRKHFRVPPLRQAQGRLFYSRVTGNPEVIPKLRLADYTTRIVASAAVLLFLGEYNGEDRLNDISSAILH